MIKRLIDEQISSFYLNMKRRVSANNVVMMNETAMKLITDIQTKNNIKIFT